MLDLGSLFGMIDQIARSSGAVTIARNVHVDVPMAKTLQPPAGSPPAPVWTLDEAAAASERASATPAGPRLLGLRPPDGALAGRSPFGTASVSQIAAQALGSLLAENSEAGLGSAASATAHPTGSNAAAAGRNAALISALTGAMAMIDREIAAAEAEAARDGASAPAGSRESDRSATAFGTNAAARDVGRVTDARPGAAARTGSETDGLIPAEVGAGRGGSAGDAEAARGGGSPSGADRIAAQALGTVLAGGAAAGIIESAILNAAMIPGYPRPRPLVGVETEQVRNPALALEPNPEADPLDEARITAFLAILGLPEAMMARIRAMLADDERRKGFLLTLMRMLKMVKLVLGSVREELEKIAEDLEEELARHGERTPQGRHRLTL